ncbi:MAG TPA: response regulator transcription factor [Spirochaetia bacterium]|nr:response regulator transcription factor [Spirochaetia bacterium]
MVPERDGGLIRISLLAAADGRLQFLTTTFKHARGFQLVVRARDLREIGPRRAAADIFIWDLAGNDSPDRVRLDELLSRMPGEPGLILLCDDPAAGPIFADLDRPWGLLAGDCPADTLLSAAVSVATGLVTYDFDLYADSGDPVFPGMTRLASPGQSVPQGSANDAVGGSDNRQPISAREEQVLVLILQGCRNREIAERLGISENTVKYHVASVYGKLGVVNRAEAVREAMQRGLLAL